MLPSDVVDVVDLLTARPIVDRVSYPKPLGTIEGDLYRPASSRTVPGVVVYLGVIPFGVEHPQVARLGEALAHSGLAALLYWSPEMRNRGLKQRTPRDWARAYESLVHQTYIDESRSRLLGTCVGGASALMAAAETSTRDAWPSWPHSHRTPRCGRTGGCLIVPTLLGTTGVRRK